RNLIAAEIGIVLPKVRVRDDATLGEQEYEIRLFGDVVARRELRIEKLLAVNDGRTTGSVAGETVIDTITGTAATWINADHREQALIYGYTTRTPTTAMTDHLEEIARSYADELLSRDATKHLLDELHKESPAMVDELVPSVMKVAEVQKALQGLLRESIPIRQLGVILEGLSDAAQRTEDPEARIEMVRARLARTLCAGLRDSNRVLHVVTLDRDVIADVDRVQDENARGGHAHSGDGTVGAIGKPSEITCDAIRRAVKKLTSIGHPPVILVAPPLRRRVKQVADLDGLTVHVLSTSEITSDTETQFHATASLSRSPAAA
ncbi:MAG: FHIPEP family type III secretion protein, partial [Planctomycetota bacterium]